jgi:hypothetical protein
MRQESMFVLLPGITVPAWNTVELKATGKKAQKRCMHDRRVQHYVTGFRSSETGRHEKLGSTWTCSTLYGKD